MNGLRICTNEIVRSGMAANDMGEFAALIAATSRQTRQLTSPAMCPASASVSPACTS
jgi:glycine/serine hydroxymethyltransferase